MLHLQTFFKCSFLKEKHAFAIQISLKYVPEVQVNCKSSLVWVMACHQTGSKPLPEKMMAQYSDSYVHQKTSVMIIYHNYLSRKYPFHKIWPLIFYQIRTMMLVWNILVFSQIPQCIRQISHNAQFCDRNVHICAHFCYKMVHWGYGTGALWELHNMSVAWNNTCTGKRLSHLCDHSYIYTQVVNMKVLRLFHCQSLHDIHYKCYIFQWYLYKL